MPKEKILSKIRNMCRMQQEVTMGPYWYIRYDQIWVTGMKPKEKKNKNRENPAIMTCLTI
jgi:regulatory protein YycH of two-component signal transduction system YycFG